MKKISNKTSKLTNMWARSASTHSSSRQLQIMRENKLRILISCRMHVTRTSYRARLKASKPNSGTQMFKDL